MGESHLGDGGRRELRRFAVAQAVADPGVLAHGARVADQLRFSFPDVADETIAALLHAAACTSITYARLTGCPHLLSHIRMLEAAAADLAHLELDPPGPP